MIDSKLNKELKEKFSPEGSILHRHQQRLLEILIFVDKICRENDIKYWLSSGTALGAVRHGGFIPWDDDVDIEMTMPEYRKFEKIMKDCGEYALQTRFSDPFYSAPYGKVRDLHSQICEHPQDGNYKYKGVYIDVFIIERNPSSLLSSIFWKFNWGLVIEGGKVNTKLERLFYFVKKHILFISINLFRSIFYFIPTNRYRHTLGGGFPNSPRYLNEILPLSEIYFEGHKFYIAGNYHAYLSRLYGDYMNLPDLDNLHFHVSSVEIY